MKIVLNLSIGYPTATRKKETTAEALGYTDEEWDWLDHMDKSEILEEWANNYIEIWMDEEK